MNRTTENQTPLKDRATIDTRDLMRLCSCGKQTAIRIGTDAGAKISIGKRTLWRVNAIMKYLDER